MTSISIDEFRKALAETTELGSGRMLLYNPYDRDGGVARYSDARDWIVYPDGVLALDTITEVEVNNGHYIVKTFDLCQEDELQDPKYIEHHVYIVTVIDPEA